MSIYSQPVVSNWWSSLELIRYGDQHCTPGHSYGPGLRHHYLLHYVLSGHGTFCHNGITYQLEAGDVFLARPEEIISYKASDTDPWHYAWLCFQAPHCPAFLQEPVYRHVPVGKQFQTLTELNKPDVPTGYVYSLAYRILWTLSCYTPVSATPDPQKKYARYAKALIDSSFMEPITIQEIADSLHIDRRYLTALFRESYGQTPKNYLMGLRLEEARSLLLQGFSATQAAEMAGFSDFSNFSRQYKQVFGFSPGQTAQMHITEDTTVQKMP